MLFFNRFRVMQLSLLAGIAGLGLASISVNNAFAGATVVPAVPPTQPIQPILYKGNTHTPLGDAKLIIRSERDEDGNIQDVLGVRNVGSTGLDGINIDIGSAVSFKAYGSLLCEKPPVGAYVEGSTYGTVGGVANQRQGSSRISVEQRETDLSKYVEITPTNLSDVGATTYTIIVTTLDGTEVYSESGRKGPAFEFDTSVLSVSSGRMGWGCSGGDPPDGGFWIYHCSFGASAQISGTDLTVTGNSFIIIPEGTLTLGPITSVQYLMSELDGADITDEVKNF